MDDDLPWSSETMSGSEETLSDGEEVVIEQEPAKPEVPREPLEPPASVTVRNLPGEVMAHFEPGPPDLQALRLALQECTSFEAPFQRLLKPGDLAPLADGPLPAGERMELTLIVDETPLYTWNLAANPSRGQLAMDGQILTCRGIRTDYINVLTQEPLKRGVHYVQFVMHSIGDEQWCGLLTDPSIAGCKTSGRSLHGYSYYCGRMRSTSNSLSDGHGALHVRGRAIESFKTLRPAGDVIGMLVDKEHNSLVFDVNGEVQGACKIPEATDMYIATHLDDAGDSVELIKMTPQDAPEAAQRLAAEGPYSDPMKGERLSWFDPGDSDSDSCWEDEEEGLFGAESESDGYFSGDA